jgi:hypothetical protein
MSGIARQVTLLSPAAIPIHHNCQVLGKLIFVKLAEQRWVQAIRSPQCFGKMSLYSSSVT